MEKAKVCFTKEITPESLMRIYEALGHRLPGKVAVKISTGESEKSNNLRPELIAPLVQKLNGTIVECCTAYGGNRQNIRKHWAEIEKRGYKEVAAVDVMDEVGEFKIPIEGGFHLVNRLAGIGHGFQEFILFGFVRCPAELCIGRLSAGMYIGFPVGGRYADTDVFKRAAETSHYMAFKMA